MLQRNFEDKKHYQRLKIDVSILDKSDVLTSSYDNYVEGEDGADKTWSGIGGNFQ